MIPLANGTPPPQTSATLHLETSAFADFGNALSISFLGESPYTFEGWFKFNGLCPDSHLFEKPGEFVMGTSGRAVYVQRAGQVLPLTTSDVLNTDDWFHIATSFDGTTLSIYINGLLSVSTSTPGLGIGNQGQDFKLGKGFQGFVDSFRIWSTGRQQQQIYQGQWVTIGPNVQNLVAEYDFTQVPPADHSGNSNPVQLMSGAASMSQTPAVNLIGSAYCEPVDDATLVNPGGAGNDSYSLLAWIYLQDTSGQQCIFANGDLSQASGIFLYVNDGTIKAQRGGTNTNALSSITVLEDSQWYCIGYTYDGTTQTIYINGQQDASGTSDAIPSMTQGDLTIGAAYSSASAMPQMNFQGYIQFISVWSLCLTAQQIGQWQDEDPTDQVGVVANYSFATDVATNLQTGNPVGLIAGAKLDVMTLMIPPNSNQFARRARPRPREAFQGSLPVDTNDVLGRQKFFTAQTQAAFLSEYQRALPGHMSRVERLNAITYFRQVLTAVAAGPYEGGFMNGVRYNIGTDGDYWTITRTSPTETIEFLRAHVDELTTCQTAEITFLVGAFDLFFGALGLTINYSVAASFFQIRIGQGGVSTALQAILTLPLAPSSILKVVAILWDFGWFPAFIGMALRNMTWWDWLTLATRVLSMIVPYPTFQKAWAIAQILMGIYEVGTAFNQAHNACPPFTVGEGFQQ